MSEEFNWQDQIKVGKEGEAIIDAFFTKELGFTITYKPTISEEKIDGYDRILTSNKGNIRKFEYKNDNKGSYTGNLFLEYLSNNKPGMIKKGWIVTSKADWFVVLVGEKIFAMRMPEIQTYYQNHCKELPARFAPNINKKTGKKLNTSEGKCPSIDILRTEIKSWKEFDASKYVKAHKDGNL